MGHAADQDIQVSLESIAAGLSDRVFIVLDLVGPGSGFLEIAEAEPARCVLIDATGDEESVHERIMVALRERLDLP